MKSTAAILKPILALAVVASQPLSAFDPLMDEPEPFAQWRVSNDLSYTASSTPTWEAASWMGVSKEIDLAKSTLDLDASMGLLYDDFQFDSSWNLEPKLAATWTKGRLAVAGWGWGLWNDAGWTDQGAGTDISWQLTDSAHTGAAWHAGIHGWMSENSGSAMGAKLSRNSNGESWSTAFALSARRLWDVDAVQARPGGLRKTVSSTATTEQWQTLFESSIDRNWESVSAGVGLDLDIRMSDASTTTSQSPMGRGKMASSSASYQYTGTLDPYANLSWTPDTWAFTATTGWSTDIAQTKGSVQPTSTFWSSLSVSKSW
ncbi:MAG: hypothetical protein AAB214_08465 [Fibrobacterota bacterium]